MDIDEPAKTFNGETVREATYPITLHISASLANSNTDYDLGEIEADLPINLEPTVSEDGRTTVIPQGRRSSIHQTTHQRRQRVHRRVQRLTNHREGR